MTATMYVVRNSEGRYRDKGVSWTENLAEAKTFSKIVHAKSTIRAMTLWYSKGCKGMIVVEIQVTEIGKV